MTQNSNTAMQPAGHGKGEAKRDGQGGPDANDTPRRRGKPKGRRVDPQALAEVQSLLGDEPRRADLLIEHLHKIQDHFKHLSSAHLAALAQEMRMAQTEVYEVASFYHHFDIVKEGEDAPARRESGPAGPRRRPHGRARRPHGAHRA